MTTVIDAENTIHIVTEDRSEGMTCWCGETFATENIDETWYLPDYLIDYTTVHLECYFEKYKATRESLAELFDDE